MKTIIAVLVLCVSTSLNLFADHAERGGKDPVVGHWRWGKTPDIADIVEDGSARHGAAAGVWKSLPTDNVQRKYKISWKGGLVEDILTLSEDGKTMHVRNSRGGQFEAVKVVN